MEGKPAAPALGGRLSEPEVSRFYVTTPIYYVNDAPHLGHAYTSVAADTLARWRRLRGDEVMFVTGTDEHGQKVQQAAERTGLTPQEHADRYSARFRALLAQIDAQPDHFIRTTDASHIAFVRSFLQRLYDEDQLYAADYSGWYSTSAERFWKEEELKDGKCPDSGLPVEWVTEKNWFFKMSAYQGQLLAHIEANPTCIQPELRRNEVLGYLRKPLEDLCISRPKSRLSWGIPLPFDPEYVTYVWFDALSNYLSALVGGKEAFWPATFHLLGKDILTFHTVYWFSMLMAGGYALPTHVYAHGWWLIEGRKMSKSLKNVVDPTMLVECYGADALRYFLLREIPFGGDGDFSHKALLVRHDSDLANDYGNLAHRALSMSTNWLGGVVPAAGPLTDADEALAAIALTATEAFDRNVSTAQFRAGIEALLELIRAGNSYVDRQAPWALNKAGDRERLATVLRVTLEVCRIAASHLACIQPKKSAELLAKLGLSAPDLAPTFDRLTVGAALTVGDPLFPRLGELPAPIQAAIAEAEAAQAAAAPEEKPKKKYEKKPEPKPKEPSVSTDAAAATTPAAPAAPAEITYDDFTKVALRTGVILSAERHPNADRLLVLKVDTAEAEPRQIVAGIAEFYAPEALVGKTVVVVTNLAPRKMRGLWSQGMLLAAGEQAALLTTLAEVPAGSSIK